jgi:quinol monooxygenase YgiN
MSVTAILDVQFTQEGLDEGLEVLRRELPRTRAFAGCRSVTVVQDHTDPTRVLAVEEWESLDADAAYREWRAGEGAITELATLVARAPVLTVGVVRDDV